MRKINRLHILIEWLMVICMISVGFSGWAITMPSEPILTEGSMNTYPVIKAEEFIEYGSVVLTHGDYGFIGDSVVVDDGGANFGSSGLILSNNGSLIIPVTLKSECFSDELFSNNRMTVEIILQLTNENGSVNKVFLSWFTLTQSIEVEETGIVNENDSDVKPTYNSQTGELKLTQSLSWNDDLTGNQDIYVYVNLALEGEVSNPKNIDQIFSTLKNPQVNIKTAVKNS